jgi:hypothetical protein
LAPRNPEVFYGTILPGLNDGLDLLFPLPRWVVAAVAVVDVVEGVVGATTDGLLDADAGAETEDLNKW